MNDITMLGIDLAKNVFQLHGVTCDGRVVVRRQVPRTQLWNTIAKLTPKTVAMEACAGVHEWGRQITALNCEVRLIAPQFVKPFVKSQKNDRNDAEAICEAALRPTMRFVALKTTDQQQILALHRLRAGAVKSRTAMANQLRGILGEFGIVAPQGIGKLRCALPLLLEDAQNRLQPLLRSELAQQAQRLRELDAELARLSARIETLAAAHEPCRRLM